jgi:RimJ/RimL family protein N-acetyltransferase
MTATISKAPGPTNIIPLRLRQESAPGKSLMYRVRPLLLGDTKLVFQFESEMAEAAKASPEVKDEHLPPNPTDLDEWVFRVMRRPAREREPVFMAMHIGTVIGMADVEHRFFKAGELHIAVLPDYWGIKVGTALMENILRKSTGLFDRINLSVYASNERATRLYSKFGFRRIGTPVPTRSEKGDDLMEQMMLIL